MQSINDFKYPSKITMNELLELGNNNKISNASFNNLLTNVSNKLLQQNLEANFEILHVPIQFRLLFDRYTKNFKNFSEIDKLLETPFKYKSPLHILNLWCSYYKDGECIQGGFIKRLNKYLKQKKNVFVYFDLHDYIINEDETKKDDNISYSVHSTCCIIYLDNNNNYNAYYFNSHGDALLSPSAYKYNKYVTRKRYKKIDLNLPLDLFVMNHLFKYINMYNKTYYNDPVVINYKPNMTYNYLGANLQEGDKFGICFVFPFMLFVNIICNFRNKIIYNVENKKYKFTSFCKLLKNNNIEKIIRIVMCNFNKDLKKLLINQLYNDELLDNHELNNEISYIIEKEGTRYTKYLYNSTLKFTCQKLFKL
jgi:hypothetical protein